MFFLQLFIFSGTFKLRVQLKAMDCTRVWIGCPTNWPSHNLFFHPVCKIEINCPPCFWVRIFFSDFCYISLPKAPLWNQPWVCRIFRKYKITSCDSFIFEQLSASNQACSYGWCSSPEELSRWDWKICIELHWYLPSRNSDKYCHAAPSVAIMTSKLANIAPKSSIPSYRLLATSSTAR